MKYRFLAFLLLVSVLLAIPVCADDSLSPEGELTLVDDLSTEYQQIITVQTRNGNYYYIIIDRTQEDGNVHFLNAVDERDLFAILKDEELPPVCTCSTHCEETAYDESCPVCAVNFSSCKTQGQPDPIPDAKENINIPAVLLMILLTICGGAGVWYYKKKKADVPGPVQPSYEDDDDIFPESVTMDDPPKESCTSAEETPATEQEDTSTMFENETEEDGWHYEP